MIDSVQKDGHLSFRVRATPRAARSEIAGALDGTLRIRLAASPVDGAANRELVKILARSLSLPLAAVEIVRGHSSRVKHVRIKGITQRDLTRLVG